MKSSPRFSVIELVSRNPRVKPQTISPFGPPVQWWILAAIAAAYFAAGKAGLMLAFVNVSATAVWPPTGIALAALLKLGCRAWPAVFAGAFLVNLTTGAEAAAPLHLPFLNIVGSSVGIAAGNTLEGVLGAWLVNRLAGGAGVFDRAANVARFALLAGMVSTAVSATLGVTGLALAGLADWTHYNAIWLTWWLGDLGGALVVAPVLILADRGSEGGWTRAFALESAATILTVLAVGGLVFGDVLGTGRRAYPLEFLCFPPLLWSAFRLGQRETAGAVFLLSMVAVWGTLRGYGHFVRSSENESLLYLQAFMGVAALMSLAVAALVRERNRKRAELRASHDDLEQRVRERTAELLRTNEQLETEIIERKKIEEELKQNRERSRLMVEAVRDYAIMMLDPDGRVVSWNIGAQRITGYTADEIIGQHLSRFYSPEDVRDGFPEREVRTALAEGRFEDEGWRVRRDGSRFWANVILTAIKDKEGKLLGFTKVTRDLTERRQAEEELRRARDVLEVRVRERSADLLHSNEALQAEIAERRRAETRLLASLREKELLLKEIHHRVKNNLQIVSSLLRLQVGDSNDPRARAQLRESQDRIFSMALVHEQLYRSADLSAVDLAEYVRGLVPQLAGSYNVETGSVTWSLEAEPVCLPADAAIPCGLILNELVSNAFKHAFAQGRPGHLRVEVRRNGEAVVMVVQDDGVGLPDGLDVRNTRSLGLQLVCSLVTQLRATLNVERQGGTRVSISFLAPAAS